MKNADALYLRFVNSHVSRSLKRHLSNISYFTYLNKLIFQFQFFVYDFPNFCGRFAKEFWKLQ